MNDDDYLTELHTMLGDNNIKEETKDNPVLNIFNTMNVFGKPKEINKLYLKTDVFYSDVYDYYYQGGYLTIFLKNITEILSLIFGISFGVFVFIMLDWSKILQCGSNNDIQDCGDISLYIEPKIPNIFYILILLFAIAFTLFKILLFAFKHKNLLHIHSFYKNTLNISSKELQTMSWSQVIEKISKHQDINLSIYDITNRILRKENYINSLLHKDILEIPDHFYTRQLEINLEYIIFNDIHNITKDNIRKKFIFYGIANLLLSVFIFIYLLSHFFVSNIDEFYSNTQTLGLRRYSLHAKWRFRHYNELKHFYEKRLNKSIRHANEYIRQFPSPVLETLCKFICIISGTFIGFFLILSLLDESILLYVRMFNRSLIFYTGIIGAISATSRSFIKSPENSIYNPTTSMQKLIKCIHYTPAHWNGKFNSYDVRNEFISMFPYIILLFLYDLLSVITTPLILIFILPSKSSDIVNFIKINTVETENIGKICSFARFETKDKDKDKKMSNSISGFAENHTSSYEETIIF